MSDKEPMQKRTQLDNIFYKNGYDCHLHCASDNAEDVIITLPAAYRPRSAATVAGFCLNESSNGFYPCIASVLSDGDMGICIRTKRAWSEPTVLYL